MNRQEAMNISKRYQQMIQEKAIPNIEGILNDNVIWKFEGVLGDVPFAGTYVGKKGVQKFWDVFFNTVNVNKVELRYVLQEGNLIHLHWIDDCTVKSTGKRYAMDTVQRWEFNGEGKLVKFRWYNDTYALYHAFQSNTDPELSLTQHTEDYGITGDDKVDARATVENHYKNFASGALEEIMKNVDIFILQGPEKGPVITKIAKAWKGPEGLAEFFKVLFENEKYHLFRPLNFTTNGYYVDVEFEEEIEVLETGKLVYCPGLHSFVVKGENQLAKFRSYNDTYAVAWSYKKD